MEKRSIYRDKKAENHAAVQNLRKSLREFIAGGGVRADFAQSINMSQTQLNQYLSGVYAPTQRTTEKWAKYLGTSHDEMMVADFEYIPYPFEELFKPKTPSKRVTKREWRQSYEAMLDEYMMMAHEGEVEYNQKVVDLMERYRI